jgi:hypothetical protein
MELELVRTYFPNGTNGELYYNGKRICSTIELPWLRNEPQISCIPEGRYELVKRYSRKFKTHFLVKDVAQRSLILIHPANNAKKELKGCIAPVSVLIAEGKGINSVLALERIKLLALEKLRNGDKVFITIKSKEHEAE